MKLAENLVLQIHAMTEKMKTTSMLQLHDTSLHLKLAMSKAMVSSLSQEPRNWGDQLHRPKDAPSGSPVKVVTTFNKINFSSFNGSAILEVTIQDVEDALLQIEIVAAKEPPLNSVSCCSPTHVAGGESNSLLLSLASANVEPSCPVIMLELLLPY
jgi:hypothetical protein